MNHDQIRNRGKAYQAQYRYPCKMECGRTVLRSKKATSLGVICFPCSEARKRSYNHVSEQKKREAEEAAFAAIA